MTVRRVGGFAIAITIACGDAGGSRGSTSPPVLGSATDGDGSSTGASTSDDDATAATATSDPGDGDTTSASSTTSADATSTTGAPVATCPPEGPLDCTPGPGEDACEKIESCFAGIVGTAVQSTVDENPTWFEQVEGGTLVLDVDAFVNTVAEKVVAAGRCAIRDPNDALGLEVGVKHDNEYAESFRLVTSDGLVRYRGGSYTATCWPAWF